MYMCEYELECQWETRAAALQPGNFLCPDILIGAKRPMGIMGVGAVLILIILGEALFGFVFRFLGWMTSQ